MTKGSNTHATSVQGQQRQRQQQEEEDYKNVPTENDIFNSTTFNNSNIHDNINNTSSGSKQVLANQLQLLGNNTNDTSSTQEPVDESNCIPDCGPFGTCTNICQYYDTTPFDIDNDKTNEKKKKVCTNQCICDNGYTGIDCSNVHVECNGYIKTIVQRYNTYTKYCYNGGSCVESTTSTDSSNPITNMTDPLYDCNCTTAYLDIRYNTNNDDNNNNFIDNPQCEYEDNIISCQVDDLGDSILSKYAYCVNGGYCRSIIEKNMNHVPCICPITQYNGRHCQFTALSIPPEEGLYVQQQIEQFNIQVQNYSQNNNGILSNSNTTSNNTSTSFVMKLIIIICVVIGILLLRFIYSCTKKRTSSTSSNRKNSRAVANALQDFDTSSDHNDDNNDNEDTNSAYTHTNNHNDVDIISNATMIRGTCTTKYRNDYDENNINSNSNGSDTSGSNSISNNTKKPNRITKTTTMTTEQTTDSSTSSINDNSDNDTNNENGNGNSDGGVMS